MLPQCVNWPDRCDFSVPRTSLFRRLKTKAMQTRLGGRMWVKNEEFRPLVISLCLVRDCMKHNTKTIHLQNLKPGDYYPHIMITSGLPRLFFFALAFFGFCWKLANKCCSRCTVHSEGLGRNFWGIPLVQICYPRVIHYRRVVRYPRAV